MSDDETGLDPENTLHLDLKAGRVVIQLLPDIAPMHVEQIKTLVRRGFYDGTPFHRVIEGFMAQGGDPTGTGTGGSDLGDIRAEFTDKAKFVRGTCGMARSQSPHSANSQFFIMFEPASHLNGQYTDLGPGGRGHGVRRRRSSAAAAVAARCRTRTRSRNSPSPPTTHRPIAGPHPHCSGPGDRLGRLIWHRAGSRSLAGHSHSPRPACQGL